MHFDVMYLEIALVHVWSLSPAAIHPSWMLACREALHCSVPGFPPSVQGCEGLGLSSAQEGNQLNTVSRGNAINWEV